MHQTIQTTTDEIKNSGAWDAEVFARMSRFENDATPHIPMGWKLIGRAPLANGDLTSVMRNRADWRSHGHPTVTVIRNGHVDVYAGPPKSQ